MDRMRDTAARLERLGEKRDTMRQMLGVPGRLVWKDSRGTTRFNSVVIRDISETGAYVESLSGSAIPMYRLVSLQAERDVALDDLPTCLRRGRILSAVFRVGPASRATGAPEGYGLRLLVEPRGRAMASTRPLATPQLAEATA
jgi:hypothetical protein